MPDRPRPLTQLHLRATLEISDHHAKVICDTCTVILWSTNDPRRITLKAMSEITHEIEKHWHLERFTIVERRDVPTS